MSMYSPSTYAWIIALRATNIASLGTWMCMVLLAPFNPPSFAVLVGACALLIWVVTTPCAVRSFLPSIKQNFRLRFARKQTTYTPWNVVRLARMMNSPIPREMQISASNKLNAATDDFTLFITSGMERELLTNIGATTLAHELAHAQYRHSSKTLAAMAALAVLACLIGAPFSAIHELAAAVMVILAFLTLTAFVWPLISRKMEYDADAKASAVFGPRAMIATLQSLVPRERWDLESDSHPSIRARVRRLGGTSD